MRRLYVGTTGPTYVVSTEAGPRHCADYRHRPIDRLPRESRDGWHARSGAAGGKRELLVSKTWLRVAGLVVLVGFFVLVLLAYRTYQSDPPIPDKVVDPSGRVLFTGNDIRAGQKVFLHHGLMEYSSIFGHGAYLGPGFTDDYLHRSSAIVQHELGGSGSDSAKQATIDQCQTKHFDSCAKTLPFSAQQARALSRRPPPRSCARSPGGSGIGQQIPSGCLNRAESRLIHPYPDSSLGPSSRAHSA